MTSIEYLIEQLEAPCRGIPSDIIEKAKEMHKQEIIDAHNKSWETRDNPYKTADKYYQETFVSKGSSTIEINNKEDLAKQYYEGKIVSQLPQQEISDEEIEKASKYIQTTNPDLWTFKIAWKQGAKWYREQLKSKQ